VLTDHNGPKVVGICRGSESQRVLAQEVIETRDGTSHVLGDFLAHPFELRSFDVVAAAVASLHHMDAARALARMKQLLRPGGALVVIGLARSQFPKDLGWEIAGALNDRLHRVTKTFWHHPSPIVWPPPVTYDDMRRLAAMLPGARYHRHLLWRYSITWTKPDRERRHDMTSDGQLARNAVAP
jgi:SAM-dependent methyltransferase